MEPILADRDVASTIVAQSEIVPPLELRQRRFVQTTTNWDGHFVSVLAITELRAVEGTSQHRGAVLSLLLVLEIDRQQDVAIRLVQPLHGTSARALKLHAIRHVE